MFSTDLQNTPRLWGLTPAQLHDRFWAARGVAVVRRGSDVDIASAELFLLLDSRWLVSFDAADVVRRMYWAQAAALTVRLRDEPSDPFYRERLITDTQDRYTRVERVYRRKRVRQVRAAMTADPAVARLWLDSQDDAQAWHVFRRIVPRVQRPVMSLNGRVFDSRSWDDVQGFVHHAQRIWNNPSTAIGNVVRLADAIWSAPAQASAASATLIPPVWIGSGRQLYANSVVIGPAVLWDDPDHKEPPPAISFRDITSAAKAGEANPVCGAGKTRHAIGKRLFDVLFSLIAIALSLPLYPLIMLAIWLEDGRPFFFKHRRETCGGREFGCMKFRSMRRDAEQIKTKIQQQNQADGPQFFIENDPRLTRVGRIIRLLNLDELPQFFNVLMGDMSIVGPRPSPHRENQYSPAWRDARLSVRPGVTGLWQVMRTRTAGTDFQEWIRYDIEYVEHGGFGMDLWIIYRTIAQIFAKIFIAFTPRQKRSNEVPDEDDLLLTEAD